MTNKTKYEKIEDEEVNEAIELINTALINYKNDNEIFEFQCPICKGQVKSILYMLNGSFHGAIECEKCGSKIHI